MILSKSLNFSASQRLLCFGMIILLGLPTSQSCFEGQRRPRMVKHFVNNVLAVASLDYCKSGDQKSLNKNYFESLVGRWSLFTSSSLSAEGHSEECSGHQEDKREFKECEKGQFRESRKWLACLQEVLLWYFVFFKVYIGILCAYQNYNFCKASLGDCICLEHLL